MKNFDIIERKYSKFILWVSTIIGLIIQFYMDYHIFKGIKTDFFQEFIASVVISFLVCIFVIIVCNTPLDFIYQKRLIRDLKIDTFDIFECIELENLIDHYMWNSEQNKKFFKRILYNSSSMS